MERLSSIICSRVVSKKVFLEGILPRKIRKEILIFFKKERGTLECKIKDSFLVVKTKDRILAQELKLKEIEILEKINSKFKKSLKGVKILVSK